MPFDNGLAGAIGPRATEAEIARQIVAYVAVHGVTICPSGVARNARWAHWVACGGLTRQKVGKIDPRFIRQPYVNSAEAAAVAALDRRYDDAEADRRDARISASTATLTIPQRNVLTLLCRGMTVTAVAAALGCTAPTVVRHRDRAIKRMRAAHCRYAADAANSEGFLPSAVGGEFPHPTALQQPCRRSYATRHRPVNPNVANGATTMKGARL